MPLNRPLDRSNTKKDPSHFRVRVRMPVSAPGEAVSVTVTRVTLRRDNPFADRFVRIRRVMNAAAQEVVVSVQDADELTGTRRCARGWSPTRTAAATPAARPPKPHSPSRLPPRPSLEEPHRDLDHSPAANASRLFRPGKGRREVAHIETTQIILEALMLAVELLAALRRGR